MKKYLILIAILAAASAVAALIRKGENTDSIIEETDDDSIMNYLGV